MSNTEIPKRKNASEVTFVAHFTERQQSVISQAIQRTIKKAAPNFLSTTGDPDRSKFWRAVSESWRELAGGVYHRDWLTLDGPTSRFLAAAVSDYIDDELRHARSERMVATRTMNIINQGIDDALERAEYNYINAVRKIRRQAQAEAAKIDYEIEIEAERYGFHLVAKRANEWQRLAQAWIVTNHTVTDGEIEISFTVSNQSWCGEDGDVFLSLDAAMTSAKARLANAVANLEAKERDEIAKAKVIVAKMAIA